MRARNPQRLFCALAVTGLATSAWASGVRILEQPNLPPFTTIQAAVNAALDGETLLVDLGAYAGFTISGKSLYVFGEVTGPVTVNGTVTVQNQSNPGTVVLSGLVVNGPSVSFGSAPPGLKLSNDAGHVRIEGCTLRGGRRAYDDDYRAGPGADVNACPQVVFVACTVTGADVGYCSGCYPTSGGDGITAIDSGVALYDCSLRGGTGSEETSPTGGTGGHGFFGTNWGVVASGCDFSGGGGGGADYIGCLVSGAGGDGLRIVNAQAHLLADVTSGGPAGSYGQCGLGANGQPITNQGGVVDVLAGNKRKFTAPAVAPDDSPLPATVVGEAGDRVFVLAARKPYFLFVKAMHGTWCVPLPLFLTSLPFAVLPSTGPTNLSIPVASLPASELGKLRFYQLLVIDAAGQQYLSSPQHVLLLKLPNVHWVDANAPPGGNGSSAAPFQDIQAALNESLSGFTVIVRDGLYTGAPNRNLDFGGRDIVVKSESGPANCVIDCQGLGRAFIVGAPSTLASRIEGLTIRNGLGTTGGAISASSVTVWDCVFESCTATTTNSFGGAIAASWVDIRRCSFRSNKVGLPTSGTAGGAIGLSPTALGPVSRIQDCVFEDNRAGWGGAIAADGFFSGTASEVLIAHCTFVGNHAGIGGGGIYTTIGQGTSFGTHIDDCLFAGNSSSSYGGAVAGYGITPGGMTRITSSTFAGNTASAFGGALSFQRTATATVENCVLWDDTAAAGNELSLRKVLQSVPNVSVSACDVQGGQAGVEWLAGTLTWGPGNLNLDPVFADPDGPDNNLQTFGDNDYTLALASPCIDAGDNNLIAADFLDIDGDGNVSEPVPLDLLLHPRRVDVPSAPNTGNGTSPLVDIGAYEHP